MQIYQGCQGPPTSDQTVCAFKHVHNFGIQPTLETIQALNRSLPLLDRIDFSMQISPVPSTASSPAISIVLSISSTLPSAPSSSKPVLATWLTHCHTMSAFQDCCPLSPSLSPPLARPSYMAPSICTDHVVTTPQLEYVCLIGDDNSNSEPPISKRQCKWVSNIAEKWDEDDMVDIYGSKVGPRQVSSFILETVCHSLGKDMGKPMGIRAPTHTHTHGLPIPMDPWVPEPMG